MKKTLILALAGILTATSMPAMAQGWHSREREWRQENRIERGIRSGRLSPREADRLIRQQRRIDRVERRARYYNGGYVDPRSARQIERMQNRAGRDIRRANRNWERW